MYDVKAQTIPRNHASDVTASLAGLTVANSNQDLQYIPPRLYVHGQHVVPHPLFCSGATRPAEIDGLLSIAHPIGVVATEASGPCLVTLAQLSYKGYPIFVDSGAYGLQQKASSIGTPGQDLDFEKVFRVYELLVRNASSARPANHLWFVMPDVVGNQRATLAVLTRYRQRIKCLLAAGAELIVPLQAGGKDALPLPAAVDELFELLGSRRVRLGIPSANARALKALPNEQLAQVRHDRFHILGMATMGPAFSARVSAIAQQNCGMKVSADAVLFRKDTATLAQLSEQYRPWIEASTVLTDYIDDTEVLGDMWQSGVGLGERQVRDIARMVHCDEKHLLKTWRQAQAGDSDSWTAMLDTCPEPWLHECFNAVLRQRVPNLQRRRARATALADLLTRVHGTGEIASQKRRHVRPQSPPRVQSSVPGALAAGLLLRPTKKTRAVIGSVVKI